MSIYRVATPEVPPVGSVQGLPGVIHVRFAPSEGAAKKFRRELAEKNALKLDEVKYEPIDMKGGKAGFIAYMNAFHAQAPASYEPAGYDKPAPKKAAKKAAKKT